MSPVTGYVIQNAGAYSTGGNEPRWVDLARAKVWKTLGAVKLHLNQFCGDTGQNGVPRDWLVFDVVMELSHPASSARLLIEPHCVEKAKQMAGYRSRYEKEQADAEKKLLRKLKAKYG